MPTKTHTLDIQKPMLARTQAALTFAEMTDTTGKSGRARPAATKKPTGARSSRAEDSQPGQRSGLIPAGDVRLTANISADLHRRLKLLAVQRGTTIGEMIEDWIRSVA